MKTLKNPVVPRFRRSMFQKALFGAPRDLRDPALTHKLSLVAFFAWVGLGADGLSSSCNKKFSSSPDTALWGNHHGDLGHCFERAPAQFASHAYSKAGDYRMILTVDDGSALFLGSGIIVQDRVILTL